MSTRQARDWLVQSRYERVRSVRDHRTHVICGEGMFEALPQTVRSCGPWNGALQGDVAALRPEYQALIEEQGFVVVYAAVTVSRPEAGDEESRIGR